MANQMTKENPLGVLPIPKLLMKFTVPSIVAILTSALYNIVDQFFIGNSVGELGNAATNVAFPLTICCIAIALVFGIGGAAAKDTPLPGGTVPVTLALTDTGTVLKFCRISGALTIWSVLVWPSNSTGRQ